MVYLDTADCFPSGLSADLYLLIGKAFSILYGTANTIKGYQATVYMCACSTAGRAATSSVRRGRAGYPTTARSRNAGCAFGIALFLPDEDTRYGRSFCCGRSVCDVHPAGELSANATACSRLIIAPRPHDNKQASSVHSDLSSAVSSS